MACRDASLNAAPAAVSPTTSLQPPVAAPCPLPSVRALAELDLCPMAISMLLWFVKRLGDIYFASFRGSFRRGGFRAWAAADKTGRRRLPSSVLRRCG